MAADQDRRAALFDPLSSMIGGHCAAARDSGIPSTQNPS
jgi:hypothetical protein